mmetsp:Transcript_146837/g.366181  ORF Transcript_146837/g.366181 Transcript_146837/m.366181 type:complete len:221 (-) Transcript_146837:49-711(-)
MTSPFFNGSITHECSNFRPATSTPDFEPKSMMARPPLLLAIFALVCKIIACSRETEGCKATTALVGNLPSLKFALPFRRWTLLCSTLPLLSNFCSTSSKGGRRMASDSTSQFRKRKVSSSVPCNKVVLTSIRILPSWFWPLPRQEPQNASSSCSQTSSLSPVSFNRLRKSSDRLNLSRKMRSIAFSLCMSQSTASCSPSTDLRASSTVSARSRSITAKGN